MVESGPRVKIAADVRTVSQGVVIALANDTAVSIPSLTAKRTLTCVKMEGRDLCRN